MSVLRHRRLLPAAALALAGVLAAVVPGVGAQVSGPSPQLPGPDHTTRPNIVVVMADDMRVDDLRWAPHVRRLIAARGVTMRSSFSPYPLCCPARASFLTGLYAHNHRVLSHERPFGFGAFDDRFTLGTALRQVGYQTAFVGKYLNGYGVQRSRVDGRRWSHVPPGWSDWRVAVEKTAGSPALGGTYHYLRTSYNVDGRIDNSHLGEYQTNTLGTMARSVVTAYAHRSSPFFLYLSFVAPHHGAPVEPDDPGWVPRAGGGRTLFVTPARPPSVRGTLDRRLTRSPGLPAGGGRSEPSIGDKPPSMRVAEPDARERRALLEVARQRAESIAVLDREVGRLVQRLKETGEYDQTIIVFTSDNGYFMGEHRQRLGKIRAHEPSLRVPLLVAGPGIPRAQDRFDPVTTIDLTATIADWAGAQRTLARHHEPDGHSVRQTIEHGDRGWDTAVVTEGLLQHLFRKAQNRRIGFDDQRDTIGVRTARYKLIRDATGWVELYDLLRDPNELRSVWGEPAYRDVGRTLDRLWRRYKDCAGAACQVPLPEGLRSSPAELRRISLTQLHGMSRRYGTHW